MAPAVRRTRSSRGSLRNSPAVAPPPAATRQSVSVVVPRTRASNNASLVPSPALNSTRSVSLASDTPDTSVVVTPAESVLKGRVGRPKKMTDLSSLAVPSNLGSRSTSAKRKRGSNAVVLDSDDSAPVIDTSRDEEMAMMLQEDEYTKPDKPAFGRAGPSDATTGASAGPSSSRPGRKAAVFKHVVLDSDEEDDELSEFHSELSAMSALEDSEDEEPLAKARPAKRARTSLPIRRRPSAKQPSAGKRHADSELVALPSDHEDHDDDDDILLSSEAEGYRRPQNNWFNKRKEKRRTKLEKAHPEIKTMWKTLEEIPVIEPVQIAQPTTITRTLKSFQLEGVDWMIKQEKSSYKGGLLGDEMGMGKTIQAVSLIMSDFPAPAPSLVLVPPVALMQWQNEINSYTDGKLKILVVHNSNAKSKNLTIKIIKQYNVILMSYNSLESMYRKQEKGWTRGEDVIKANSPVHAIKWHRIILDEAHSIKSRNTGSAKSCFALKATYKWCLSGTPVQNRIGEFFSLLRFLEVRPFADYFCEACDCAQLHWTIDENYRCTSCKHSSSEHRSVFNEEILNPITNDNFEERDAALDKLHMVTNRIMLRRMKQDHTASMELPPKLIQIRNQFFSKIERDFSSSIMTNTVREFDTYVSRGVVLNNYANIFGLIMQMRQVANHPDLILRKNAEGGQNVLVCNICDEPAEDAIRSQCKHEFCRSCVKSYVSTCTTTGDDIDCPRCHIPLSIDFEAPEIEQDTENVKKSSIINRIRMSDWTSSTKIELLIYELFKLRSSKRTLKSIVFSQFTSMLQLVEWRLRRAGFTTVMLDGSMTPVQRQRSIDYFMKNHHVEVFLVSLKAGGVALNLTEASRVFIIDPWWNPAAEWQSADRCHRIGQARPCVITRLVIEDSVESRMVQLQEKKANLIASTVNKDKSSMEKLTPEDLQFLFRGT